MTKLWDTRGSNSGSFSSTDLNFSSFIAKYLKFKPYQCFYEILKIFQVITIKLRRFLLRKCYLGVLAVKYKQSGLSKIADTVLDCKQCQIWNWCNNWCHQTQHVRLGTSERKNKGQKTRRSFSLFIWNHQIKIKQRFREFNKLFSDI